MVSQFYSGLEGYRFCEMKDDGANYVYYLYNNKNGKGYIMRESKEARGTVKYTKVAAIVGLWDFVTHLPKITGEIYYHYFHNHPSFPHD